MGNRVGVDAAAVVAKELVFGLRMLARSPATTLLAVLTLALGIGVNTAVFSIVNALFLEPLPDVRAADRLVAGWGASGGTSGYVNFLDLRARNRSFEGMAAFKALRMDLVAGEATEGVDGMIVTADYFPVLGVEPALGRFFLPEEDRDPNAEAVVVLGHHLWRTRYAADPAMLGREIVLNGRGFVVVGVAPEGFRGTNLQSRPALFAPMMMQPHFMPDAGNLLHRRGWEGIYFFGRLAPGIDLATARADVDRVAAEIGTENPALADFLGYSLTPLSRSTLVPGTRSTLVRFSGLLMAAVGIVLLVACVNVANLQLARAIRRRREISVRRALGAGRLQLIRQLLIESCLLAILGGVAGLGVATWTTRAFRSIPFPFDVDFALDGRVLAFTAALTLGAGLIFGLAPALRATRTSLGTQLKDGGASVANVSHLRFSSSLVVAQVALSLLLLVMAGLFVRTVIHLGRVELGFEPSGVAVSTVNPGLQGYEGPAVGQYYRQLLTDVRAIPGVVSASLVSDLPGPGNDDVETLEIVGTLPEEGRRPSVPVSLVGDGYFETLRIPIEAGRVFNARDDPSSPPVVMVNAAAARRFEELSGRRALGLRVRIMGIEAEVVGVAADSKAGSLRDAPSPRIYIAHGQASAAGLGNRMALVVRSAVDVQDTLAGLRHAARRIDPDVPLWGAQSLESHLASTLVQERLSATLLAAVAGLALVLASVGLYGVLGYSVSQRTAELGIRIALGADRFRVLAMVVGQGLRLAAIGIGVGLLAALASSRLVSGFLFVVESTDTATYATVAGIMAAVAVLASYLPALRATLVDPVAALRSE